MKAYGVPWDKPLSEHPMEKWICTGQGCRGLVTRVYNSLIDRVANTLAVEKVWERDLHGISLEPDWESIWSNMNITSKNLAHQLIHFKMIHRAYATPIKCFKMKLITDPNCTHCQAQTPGTTMHMFWECSVINDFWVQVMLSLSELLGSAILPSPDLCLLNDVSSLSLNLNQRRLLLAGLTAAKKTILSLWYNPNISLMHTWMASYQSIASLECTTARLNRARSATVQAWSDIAVSIRDYLKRRVTPLRHLSTQ